MSFRDEIAWLAGLWEGEGCFLAMKRNTIAMKIGMTDRDVIERAAAIVGGPSIGERKTPGHKTLYWFVLCGHTAASWMMILYQFMGARRRAKIRECLANWRPRLHPKCQNPDHNPPKRGEKWPTSSGCPACTKARHARYAKKKGAERAA
jgi:hypothetical protein